MPGTVIESVPGTAFRLDGPGGTGYIITNQHQSFDWRARGAKAHPWKQAPENVFEAACAGLNQIIAICAG